MPRVEHIAVAPGAPAPLPVCDRWRQLCETAQGTHVSQALIIYAVWSVLLSGVPCGTASARIFGMSGARGVEWSAVGWWWWWHKGREWGAVVDYSVSSCAQSAGAVCQQHPEPCEPLHGCVEMINGAETCRLSGAFGLMKSFFVVLFFPLQC